MKQTKKHSKGLRLLSAVLALVMALSLLPLSVFAEERTQDSPEEIAPQATTEISYVAKTKSVPLNESTFYRIVHIDCGRKYFTVAELEKIIDYAAKYHYTHVELAFGNDALRFLLDDMSVTANGKTYASDEVTKAIQAGNKAFYDAGTNELTQSEMDNLITYAASKNIGIIPMFDAPGHLQAVIRAMNTLGISMVEGTNYCRATKSATSYNWALYADDVAGVNFLQALYQKYVNYFAGKTTMFNIAADECGFSYDDNTKNPAMSNERYTAYAKLVNSLAAMVQNAGMTALTFNDGLYHKNLTTTTEFDTNIAVCYWDASSNKYASAATLASKGFKIINTHNKWYYVPGTSDNGWFGYEWSKGYMNGDAKDCTVTDGGYTTKTGCMNAIWFDDPSQTLTNTIWTKIENHIKDLSTNNPDYFTAVTDPITPVEPEISIKADKTALVKGDKVTLSLVNSNETATWTCNEESVIKLNTPEAATATSASGNSVIAEAIGTGTATVTAAVGDKEYSIGLTVTEQQISLTQETINLTVGQTATRTQDDDQTAKVDRTGLDTTIADVDVKYEQVEGKTEFVKATSASTGTGYIIRKSNGKYLTANAEETDDITQAATWTYTYSYYGSYCFKNGSSYLRYNNGFTTTNYRWDDGIEFTVSNGSLRYNNSAVGTIGTMEKTDPVNATTITFTGKKAGTTTIIVGNVQYTINVTKESLDGVAALPIQLWITNIPIELDTTKYTGGSTSGSFRSNNSWSEQKAWYVDVDAKDAYGEKGVALSKVLPEQMYRYENNITYWIKEYTDKAQMDLRLWSGRVHTSSNMQKVWDVDYSNSGTEFNYVRYYGGEWAVSADGQSWTSVTGNGSKVSYSSCTEQLAVYYMLRTDITKEVSTDVADWGYVNTDSNYSAQINKGYYVMLDFAVKYEGGTRNPDTFPQDGKTFVFHCNTGDSSGAVKQDSSGNDYRQLSNFRGVNSADYEIYMVTVTMTEDAASDTLTSTTSYKYNGEEQIVWAIDEAARDDSGLNEYQAITSGDTTYSGCTIGGDPYVRGVEVYNKHGALITYYIRAKITEDFLRVHYIDDSNGYEFYKYDISVKSGTLFNEGFAKKYPDNGKDFALINNTVENFLGVTETVNADLTSMFGVPAQYRYSDYECVRVTRENDGEEVGKHVYLYYNFTAAKTFVVDFGLPLKIRPQDVGDKLANAKITRVSVGDSAYAKITTDNEYNIIYTLIKSIDGKDNITARYYGKNAQSGEEQNVAFTITIIPASNVYYEDSFARFDNGAGAAAAAQWDKVGTEKTDVYQALEELGEGIRNVYGYDAAYDNCTMFSMGSAHTVNVTSAMAANWNSYADSAWPTATFTFKGTGFDVISLTNNTSGAIFVDVVKTATGTAVKNLLVDNYYGYKQEGNTWVVDPTASDTLYQIPVMKVTGLHYDEYTVTIKVAYSSYFDHTANKTNYNFWLDAIRVYDPMGENAEYTKDGEGYPQYIKLRDAIAKDGTAEVKTALFIDGAENADITTYANYGPNNEVYLAKGQAITFNVQGENIASVQIGAKAPKGAASMVVNQGTAQTINTATEMYYTISNVGGQFTITNTGEGILSLTNLKITFTQNSTASLAALTTQEQNDAVMAVRALFTVAPEPFEPSRFEASWNRTTVRAGQKATLIVKTSEDVDAITVNGQTITTFRVRTERTGWGWWSSKVTYREFTYSVTPTETTDYAVAAVNAEGVASEPQTFRLTVSNRGFGGWLKDLFRF